MAEQVKLKDSVVQKLEGKMRRDNVAFRIVGRVLNRSKVVYVVFFRNYDYTSRVLSGAFFDAGTAVCKPLLFSSSKLYSMFFKLFADISVSVFISERSERSGAEHVFSAEKNFGVFVYHALYVT